MQLNRNGFLYVLDRTNGKLLSAKPFEKVNWATHVDMATGRPVESDVSKRVRDGEQIELWPSQWGAKNWPHAAFNPETGLLYANTMHVMRYYRFVPVGEYKPGRRPVIHRQGDRRVHRARHRHRQDAVAVPDRLGRQRATDHLHAQGKAVRRGAVRPRRGEPESDARAAQERAVRRIGMDVCVDAGVTSYRASASMS